MKVERVFLAKAYEMMPNPSVVCLPTQSIWESPIYRFVLPVERNRFKEVFLDVTHSAPTGVTETGKELRDTFDWVLGLIGKREPKVLDFGAGRLRNVSYLLEKGCRVTAVEFKKLKEAEQTKRNLALAKAQKYGDRFDELVFPSDFLKPRPNGKDGKFDLVLFINVLSIMPVPSERALVLKYCREKLADDGLMLWFTQATQSFYKEKFDESHRLGDGYVVNDTDKYKTFLKEYKPHEVDELFLSDGLRFEDRNTVPHVVSRAYRRVGRNPLEFVLSPEVIRKYVEGDMDYEEPKKVNPDLLTSKNKPRVNSPMPDELSVPTLFGQALTNIPVNDEYASAFQNLVAATFIHLFVPPLKDCELETVINNGQDKVDITFKNNAETGFFHDLRASHGLKCPYVFIECKNISTDLGNVEFGQLIERVHTTKNHFGIIACRKNTNKEEVLKHAKKASKIGEDLLMWLEVEDLKEMLRRSDSPDDVDSVLEDIVKEILL